MRATLTAIALLLLLACTGCESMRPTVKADNPVIGPPPPRIAHAGRDKTGKNGNGKLDGEKSVARSASADGEEGGIRPVSRSVSDQLPFDDELVVAKVNGTPIFAREIFEQDRERLSQLHSKVEEFKGTPQYAEARKQERIYRQEMLRVAIPHAVERRMLALAIRGSVKDAQFKQIEEAVEENYREFERERMKHKEIQASTPEEFREKLRARGYDPDQFKQMINENYLAQIYMQLKRTKSPEPSRSELLAYYREHKQEYAYPEQVKWQQIQVLESRHGGMEQARAHIDRAVDELLAGKSFPDVAREYSDGISADEGGQWDWMKRNVLADKELEKRLFTMPIGEVSPVFESAGSLQVVAVLDRREEGVKPFEDVQKEISKKLIAQSQSRLADKIIEELKEQTVVWTIFDDETALGEEAERDRPRESTEESLQPLTAK